VGLSEAAIASDASFRAMLADFSDFLTNIPDPLNATGVHNVEI
jgi:hypothetical protein